MLNVILHSVKETELIKQTVFHGKNPCFLLFSHQLGKCELTKMVRNLNRLYVFHMFYCALTKQFSVKHGEAGGKKAVGGIYSGYTIIFYLLVQDYFAICWQLIVV